MGGVRAIIDGIITGGIDRVRGTVGEPRFRHGFMPLSLPVRFWSLETQQERLHLSHGTRANGPRKYKHWGFAGAACQMPMPYVRHASDWRPLVVDDRPIRIPDVPGMTCSRGKKG